MMDMDESGILGDCKFSSFLSNYDVCTMLQEIKDKTTVTFNTTKVDRKRIDAIKSNTQLMTIIYEALQFFKDTPCTSQNPEVICEFIKKMQPYKLTKTEKLNILNLRPNLPVVLSVIVEESEERLTEEQIDEMLLIIEEILPPVSTSLGKSELAANKSNSSSEENVFERSSEESSS